MLILLVLFHAAIAQPIHVVTNPRARLVPELDIIYVEWQLAQSIPDAMFTVRHSANKASWNYVKTAEANVRIPISAYRDGEQVHIQTRVEKAGTVIEDWTQDIVVAIKKKNVPQNAQHYAPASKQSQTQFQNQNQHQSQKQNPAEMAPLALSLAGPPPPPPPQQPASHHQPPQQVPQPLRNALNLPNAAGGAQPLPPPIHFTANIMGPTTVQLQWRPPMPSRTDIFYLVNVKQLTTSTGTTLQNQQIKTAATSFTLGKMIAGEKYEMTIRSASNQESASSTASFVEITMPNENDYFEIGNLIISSHFSTPSQGIVNLTWDVPPTMNQKIASYNVEYSEMGTGYWQKIQFHGASSSATLHHLKSNTEYLLRIKTVLKNNIITESGQFRIRTPKVEINPIHKVDVIFSHDVNSVKLQWILEKHVNLEKVAGYDVYLSQNKDLPDSQWKMVRLDKKESSLNFDNLESSTNYYVRVNVRSIDGSVIRAPLIYRFKTIDDTDEENIEGNSLSYRNIAPGQVEIRWTFPKHILDSVIGASVLYSDRKDLAPDEWQKVEIDDSKNTTLVLQNLREGTRYSVQIIPRLYTGDYDFESRELFEFKTDKLSGSTATGSARDDRPRVLSLPGHPLSGPQFEHMEHSESEFMRIVGCNPDAIKTGCAWDEMCIIRVDDRKKGWCISNTLRDSILFS